MHATTSSSQSKTIDFVDSLTITQAEVQSFGNELMCLDFLGQGLQFLNGQVEQLENEMRQNYPGLIFMIPGMSSIPLPEGLLASMFHWYAVSACNYIRLVGWIGYGRDSGLAMDYLKSVAPKLKLWRDKVGAHFAQVNPTPSDTPADLLATVFFPVAWANDSFWAQPFTFTLGQGAETSTTRDMSWSLTETHRVLAQRYWPDELGGPKHE